MKKSWALGGVMFLFVLLACGGTVDVSEENVRVTGLPQFVCPSSTPRPKDTAVPTRTQMPTAAPPIITTPMVYVSYPPVCNYAVAPSYQYVCAPNACLPAFTGCGTFYTYPLATPNPAGFWYGGGTGLGPT